MFILENKLNSGSPILMRLIILSLGGYQSQKKRGNISVTYLESLHEGDGDFHDVHEFGVLDPKNEPFGTMHLFDSVEASVAFAMEKYGASADRFVAGGMICQEYEKYLLNRK
jgi:hypothetical protein